MTQDGDGMLLRVVTVPPSHLIILASLKLAL